MQFVTKNSINTYRYEPKMKVIYKNRKTNFLTPSGLKCLAGLPTVNISAGCAHKCVYCYTKGYSIYPGDEVVELYENMAERIESEICRKRQKPQSVYFCPSCDPFQPVEQVQQISFDVMKMLLSKGIGIQFVTKGKIAEQTMHLFQQNSSLISGQIGITTVDDTIRQTVEPYTATVEEKLTQLKQLISYNIKMSVRCDPLFHGIMDSKPQLDNLCKAINNAGCKELAISFLFLRPAITKSLKQNITDKRLLQRILQAYSNSVQLPIGIRNSVGNMLPTETRKGILERIEQIAGKYNIKIHTCGCKNSDITNDTCYLTRPIQDNNLLFYTD